ncbi:MAG: hypothetical protein ACM3NR_00810 [Methanosarcina sp.]
MVLQGQPADYASLFASDWEKANSFLAENRTWMEPVLKRNHISYKLAAAVIFPELLRYSFLRDKMEITLLKSLYINLGEDYANFSIGQFQIKPSFANLIRQEAPAVLTRRSGIVFRDTSEFDNISDYRKSIITDLEDAMSEFNYVVAFIRICEKKYDIPGKDEADRLKFIATAYNYGIDKTRQQIEAMESRKFFHLNKYKSGMHSYSDVSLFWYNNNK